MIYDPRNRSLFNRYARRNLVRLRSYIRRATSFKRLTTGFPFYRWPPIEVDRSNWKDGKYLPLQQDKVYQRFMNA